MWVSGLIRDQKTTQSWDAFNAGHTFHILARERKHLRVQSGLVSLFFFIMTHLINSLWHWSNNQRWSLLHLETAFSVATSISNFRHYPDIIQWIFFFFLSEISSSCCFHPHQPLQSLQTSSGLSTCSHCPALLMSSLHWLHPPHGLHLHLTMVCLPQGHIKSHHSHLRDPLLPCHPTLLSTLLLTTTAEQTTPKLVSLN